MFGCIRPAGLELLNKRPFTLLLVGIAGDVPRSVYVLGQKGFAAGMASSEYTTYKH